VLHRLSFSLCERERAPFAVMGEATKEQELILSDELFNSDNLAMNDKFSNTQLTKN
jgi:phosphoribosylformylglycinamidine synthase